MEKIFDYIIAILCIAVAIILKFDLLPISSEKQVFVCIFILLGDLFFKRKVDE